MANDTKKKAAPEGHTGKETHAGNMMPGNVSDTNRSAASTGSSSTERSAGPAETGDWGIHSEASRSGKTRT